MQRLYKSMNLDHLKENSRKLSIKWFTSQIWA